MKRDLRLGRLSPFDAEPAKDFTQAGERTAVQRAGQIMGRIRQQPALSEPRQTNRNTPALRFARSSGRRPSPTRHELVRAASRRPSAAQADRSVGHRDCEKAAFRAARILAPAYGRSHRRRIQAARVRSAPRIRLVLVSACDTAGRCLKSNLDPRQGTAMRTPVRRTTICISSAIAAGRDAFRVAANSQPSRIGAGFRRNV